MAETITAAAIARQPSPVDLRVARSKPDVRRFVTLVLQLALLLVVFKVYGLEQPAFFLLACLIFAGAAVSYWLPFRYKEPFLIALSLAGAWILLPPLAAGLLIATGLTFFAVVRSALAFRWKVLVILAIFAVAIYGRATGRFPVPREFWPVMGSVFMFRMIVYLYDLRYATARPPLKDYLSYFFLLPNYYFLLFPVVDFQTFRKSYFKRDINVVAQQGIWWILRGTTHLLLYRVIYQAQGSFTPPKVPVAVAVIVRMFFSYLLILRVSGQFHIIAGMLCLFGYDLPETNHKYLLANSINDFWRRASIYWKDFMVKVVYFPVYFGMRRMNELRAKLVATMLVFVVTWFLHSMQFFWLQGRFKITLNDTLFWAILGSLVLAEVWIGALRKTPKRIPVPGWRSTLRNGLQVALTLATISTLWSMWSSRSMEEWFYFLRNGHV